MGKSRNFPGNSRISSKSITFWMTHTILTNFRRFFSGKKSSLVELQFLFFNFVILKNILTNSLFLLFFQDFRGVSRTMATLLLLLSSLNLTYLVCLQWCLYQVLSCHLPPPSFFPWALHVGRNRKVEIMLLMLGTFLQKPWSNEHFKYWLCSSNVLLKRWTYFPKDMLISFKTKYLLSSFYEINFSFWQTSVNSSLFPSKNYLLRVNF